MPDSFQSTNHTEAKYNRPNQGWLCGGDCRDCPCYLGPDRAGRCQAGKELDGRRSGQCLPRKVGAHWACTRPDTHGVAACEQGPLPDGSCCQEVPRCQPRRSLRKQRGLFTFAISIVTVAVLIIAFSDRSGDQEKLSSALNAGPLSGNHSHIEKKCSACHSDQRLTLSRIADLHAASAQHRAIEDGKLCLACHDSVGGEDASFAFAPHTAPPFERQWKGQGKSSRLIMAVASSLAAESHRNGSIHCATCHQEHHGTKIDITAMSNRQCQVCHQNQFASFSKGHPEFGEVPYPYRRRTGIRFDHYSHYQTHFQEEREGEHPARVPAGYDPDRRHEESTSCQACHVPESSGKAMIVKPFESSCAACHDESTRGGEPIPFLAFPSLNTVLLNEKLAAGDPPRSLGTWIEEAPNSIPWPTLQLLSQDARDAWKSLRRKKVDPFDPALTDLDAESLKEVERIAWAIKELARDLSQSSPQDNPSQRVGHDELIRRFTEAGFDEPALLMTGLPPGLVDAMKRGFSEEKYLRLLGEVDAYRKGSFPTSGEPATAPAPANPPEGGPVPPDGDTGESFGDDPPAEAPAEDFGADAEEENFGEDAKEEDFAGEAEEDFAGEAAKNGEEVFGPEEDEPEESAPPAELPAIDPAVWATQGGWYQQYGVVSYRSTGHADPLLKHWLDELARQARDPLARAQLAEGFDFQRGSQAGSAGQCFRCHSVDEVRNDAQELTGARINWRSLISSSPRKSLTQYDHSTHLLLMDCRSCHYTAKGEDTDSYLKAFPGDGDWDFARGWSTKADPSRFQSSFSDIQKRTCASCHTSAKAGDHCTQCHQYHLPR